MQLGNQRGMITMTQAVLTMGLMLVISVGSVGVVDYQLGHLGDTDKPVASSYAARNVATRIRAATAYDTNGTVTSGLQNGTTWNVAAPSPAPSATAGAAIAYGVTVAGCNVSVSAARANATAKMQFCAHAQALPPNTTLDSTH